MSNVITFEERVILAAQFGRRKAIQYLLVKWELPKNKLVAALARRHGLIAQDASDARQEAVFWLLDAIQKYRFEGPLGLREYRLKAFLRITISRRMSNFVRGLRRSAQVAAACGDWDSPLSQSLTSRIRSRASSYDPAEQCADDEFCEVIRRKISRHGELCERLYDALLAGCTPSDAARRLRISSSQARTLHRRIKQAVEFVGKPS